MTATAQVIWPCAFRKVLVRPWVGVRACHLLLLSVSIETRLLKEYKIINFRRCILKFCAGCTCVTAKKLAFTGCVEFSSSGSDLTLDWRKAIQKQSYNPI